MTHIEPVRRNWLLRLLNWGARRRYGKDFDPLAVMAHNPRFLIPYVGMNTFAHGKTRLAPEVRSLAMLLVGELNRCSWCIDFGRHESEKTGISADKLTAVASHRTHPAFSPAERAALAFAEEAAQIGAGVSDETFARVREHFDEREIVELTAAVAAEKFFNTFNAALGIEAQGFCALPAARKAVAA